MYFQSLDALLHMDGHGGFVWAAYVITAVVVMGMLLLPRRREARLLKQVAGDLRRQRAAASAPVSATASEET